MVPSKISIAELLPTKDICDPGLPAGGPVSCSEDKGEQVCLASLISTTL